MRYFLELCLKSVQQALRDLDAEIIVVDNNSKDNSCAMVKALFPDVKLIENKTNSGFSKGNNMGVKHAKGDYLCILNPDTVVAEDTFVKLLEFAENKNKLGIILNTDPHNKSGEHWISMFVNIKKRFIVYFDSNGNEAPKQVIKLINTI